MDGLGNYFSGMYRESESPRTCGLDCLAVIENITAFNGFGYYDFICYCYFDELTRLPNQIPNGWLVEDGYPIAAKGPIAYTLPARNNLFGWCFTYNVRICFLPPVSRSDANPSFPFNLQLILKPGVQQFSFSVDCSRLHIHWKPGTLFEWK
jgi:hypothetical protein